MQREATGNSMSSLALLDTYRSLSTMLWKVSLSYFVSSPLVLSISKRAFLASMATDFDMFPPELVVASFM